MCPLCVVWGYEGLGLCEWSDIASLLPATLTREIYIDSVPAVAQISKVLVPNIVIVGQSLQTGSSRFNRLGLRKSNAA